MTTVALIICMLMGADFLVSQSNLLFTEGINMKAVTKGATKYRRPTWVALPVLGALGSVCLYKSPKALITSDCQNALQHCTLYYYILWAILQCMPVDRVLVIWVLIEDMNTVVTMLVGDNQGGCNYRCQDAAGLCDSKEASNGAEPRIEKQTPGWCPCLGHRVAPCFSNEWGMPACGS